MADCHAQMVRQTIPAQLLQTPAMDFTEDTDYSVEHGINGKRRLIKQNKIFISIIASLFILFGFTFTSVVIRYTKRSKMATWEYRCTALLSGKELSRNIFLSLDTICFLRDIHYQSLCK